MFSCLSLIGLLHITTTVVLFLTRLQIFMATWREGHKTLVSGLVMGIVGVVRWLIGVINLVSKSPPGSKP